MSSQGRAVIGIENTIPTPDYDLRPGTRDSIHHTPSLTMSINEPIGYRRKHPSVVGTRVDTAEEAFKTTKPEDRHRASRVFHALITRYKVAVRPTDRMDYLRWLPESQTVRPEFRYPLDDETRQDFATPSSQETKLPDIDRFMRYADKVWVSEAEVQREIEKAVAASRRRQKEHPPPPPPPSSSTITTTTTTTTTHPHSLATIDRPRPGPLGQTESRTNSLHSGASWDTPVHTTSLTPIRSGMSSNHIADTSVNAVPAMTRSWSEPRRRPQLANPSSVNPPLRSVDERRCGAVSDVSEESHENTTMTALPKRAVSKRPAHHDGMDQTLEYSKGERPNSAKRTRLDSTSDTRRKTEVYRNVTDSSNVVEQSSSDTKHTINGSVMGHAVDPYAPGRRKFVLPDIPAPVSPTWPEIKIVASIEKSANDVSTKAIISKQTRTTKSGKRAVPMERANRGGKRAVPVDPAFAIAQELASDKALCLDEFLSRHPELPRTTILPQRLFVDHVLAFEGETPVSTANTNSKGHIVRLVRRSRRSFPSQLSTTRAAEQHTSSTLDSDVVDMDDDDDDNDGIDITGTLTKENMSMHIDTPHTNDTMRAEAASPKRRKQMISDRRTPELLTHTTRKQAYGSQATVTSYDKNYTKASHTSATASRATSGSSSCERRSSSTSSRTSTMSGSSSSTSVNLGSYVTSRTSGDRSRSQSRERDYDREERYRRELVHGSRSPTRNAHRGRDHREQETNGQSRPRLHSGHSASSSRTQSRSPQEHRKDNEPRRQAISRPHSPSGRLSNNARYSSSRSPSVPRRNNHDNRDSRDDYESYDDRCHRNSSRDEQRWSSTTRHGSRDESATVNQHSRHSSGGRSRTDATTISATSSRSTSSKLAMSDVAGAGSSVSTHSTQTLAGTRESIAKESTTGGSAPTRHLNLKEYKMRLADRQPENNTNGPASGTGSNGSQPQQPPASLDSRLSTLQTTDEQKLRLNYHFQLARRYNKLIERAKKEQKATLTTAYHFVKIMNEMVAYEAIQELRSNESYDALLQSISDWEASITTLCSLAEDLKQDHEPVFAGLCYRLAAIAQQRVLDIRLRAESIARSQQLVVVSEKPEEISNEVLADHLSKASIAFYRVDADNKKFEQYWRAADATFTLSGIRREFPHVWQCMMNDPATTLDPAFGPYTSIRQVVPLVWELVREYARRRQLHGLPDTLPMDPPTSSSTSRNIAKHRRSDHDDADTHAAALDDTTSFHKSVDS